VEHFPSRWDIAKTSAAPGGIALGAGLVQYLADWSTILTALGAPSSAASIAPLAATLITITFGLFALANLRPALALMYYQWVRYYGRVYLRQEDGTVSVLRITGKCPIPECPGTLSLGNPGPNEEGVTFATVCSKHGFRHAFEFNDETHKGRHIRLTPQKTQ